MIEYGLKSGQIEFYEIGSWDLLEIPNGLDYVFVLWPNSTLQGILSKIVYLEQIHQYTKP